MAVTSESSAVSNFPLRTFNTGPGFIRDATPRDQQSIEKSAMERLTESRSKYVRRGSWEELEDKGEENRTNGDTHRAHQVHTTHEETQVYMFRAVPYVQASGRGFQPAKKPSTRLPPPVPDKPSQAVLTRRGSKDRTLEIVEASLGHSLRRSSDDVGFSPKGAVASPDSSSSNSPSAGSRIRRLKQQLLTLGSAESGSESSQGQVSPTENLKSSSLSDSRFFFKKNSFLSNPQDAKISDFEAPSEELLQQPSRTLSGKSKLLQKSKVEVADCSQNPCTASEDDHSPTTESETKSKPQQASAAFLEGLSDQTRRQMERFRARYATDTGMENNQERKINRIILKPSSQAAETKSRNHSVNEPYHKFSSGMTKPRLYTAKDENTCPTSPVASNPDSFSTPHAPVNNQSKSEKDGICPEEINKNRQFQKLNAASHHDGMLTPNIPQPMTSEGIRRLRRTKEFNISGKSSERWGDAEETSKNQKAVLEHAVHHPVDRVLVQVSGSVFPSKHHVSDTAFQTRLQPENTPQEEIIHRRSKSDLDCSNAALGTTNENTNSNRMRHLSQDDKVQHDLLFPQSTRKNVQQNNLFKHTKTSPENIKDFKKKAWAPVNFCQNQKRNDPHKEGVKEGLIEKRRAMSPDLSSTPTTVAESQNPPTHVHVLQENTARKISQEDSHHEHAKSRVQTFLSGIMSSPGSGEIQVGRGTFYNDGNGNHIFPEFSDDKTDTTGTHWARPAEVSGNVNANISSALTTCNKAQVTVSKDVELTAVSDEREPSMTVIGEEASGEMEHRRKNLGQSKEEERTDELEKRRRFSHNLNTSSSKQDRVHLSLNDAGRPHVEPQRVKKVSLADLLSKDATQEKKEAADQLSRTKVMKCNQDWSSNWSAPLKPDKSHEDDSETDSNAELQRSKVLRLKKPQKHANQKKEDKSLENLLSRIINPDDELNTLKRGTKLKTNENPKAKVSRRPSRNTCSSSTAESDSEVEKEKVLAMKKFLPKRDNRGFQASAPGRRDLPNWNQNNQPVHCEDAISPPESLASPTRSDFPRRRSKSDLGMSPRCSVSSAHSEVEHFFNQMGLNESCFQGPLSPMPYSDEDEVFHDMHEYKHVRDDDGTSSTENSDNISQGSKVSEEGLRLAKKLPDTSKSIITKNARVIKWLCQMRKARAASVS